MINTKIEILLAEDNVGHAGLIKIYLNEAGINENIKHFKNGEEILNYLMLNTVKSSNINYIILLDIRMPKIDGIEVLKRIKNDEVFKKIPVIMLTTTENQIDIEKCYKYGCNIYFNKPLESEKFEETFKLIGKVIKTVKLPEF